MDPLNRNLAEYYGAGSCIVVLYSKEAVVGEDYPRGAPAGSPRKEATRDPPALSRSLAWIQEKNFEDKFEVVRIIG